MERPKVSSTVSVDKRRIAVVEKCVSHPTLHGGTPSTRSVFRPDYGRCLGELRLGGTLQSRSVLSGGMVRHRPPGPYKQEGNYGGTQIDPGHDAAGGLCPPVPGQHDGRVLHKPTGRDSVATALQGGHQSVADCSVKGWLGPGLLGAARRESVIRSAVKVSSAHLGLFSRQADSRKDLGSLVQASGRRFCQSGMSPGSSVLQLVSGSPGNSQGCLLGQGLAQQSILLPSSTFDSNDFGQDQNRQDHSFDCGPSMETSFVVGHLVRDDGGEHHDPTLLLHHSVLSTTSEQKGAILAPSSSLPCVRGQDLPLLTDEAKDLLVHDVRPGTDKIYRSRFKIFSDYCVVNGFDPTTCPVEIVTNFLSELKGRGLKYQTICGYRSAISRYHSMVGNDPIGSAPLVKRVTKACFNQAPPIPKYSDMWDVNKLMEFLETMNPNSSLSIFDLGMKAVALISSLSLSRQSSVAALAPQFQVMDQKIHISLTKLEKTSRPTKVRSEVILPSGDSHPPLSLALCLSEYIERTELRREYYSKAEGSRPSQLFISNIKPYQSVLPSTLAKWLLTAMDRAGICTASYRAHSVRSASASDMRSRGMSLSQVLQRGNWSTRTRTFAIFYDRSSLA